MNNEVSSRASHWLKGPAIIAALTLLIAALVFFVRSCDLGNDSGSKSVILKPEDIGKLVTVEQTMNMEHVYTTTWHGSTKTLIVAARYRARGGVAAGADMIRIIIPEGNKGRLTTIGLHGELISCEMVEHSFKVVKDDDGIWNRLTSEDHAIAVNQMNAKARKISIEHGLERLAVESFRRFLRKEVGLPLGAPIKAPIKDSEIREIRPTIAPALRESLESIKRQLNS